MTFHSELSELTLDMLFVWVILFRYEDGGSTETKQNSSNENDKKNDSWFGLGKQ